MRKWHSPYIPSRDYAETPIGGDFVTFYETALMLYLKQEGMELVSLTDLDGNPVPTVLLEQQETAG